MAIKNPELMIQILENDCQIKGIYVSEDGETCAIGALLKETGFDMSYFQKTRGPKQGIGVKNNTEIVNLPKALRHLHEHFGLNKKQAKAIQHANDSWIFDDTLAKRRERVLATASEFIETPQ